jgi:anti-sigma factor RsiW
MRPRPDHEELSKLLPAAALDILDQLDRKLLLDHVSGCPECTRLLKEYRQTAGLLAGSLPPEELEPSRALALRSRVLAGVRGRPKASKQPSPRILPPSRAILAAERWSGWTVAAALAALLVNHHAFHRPLDYGWIVAGILAVALVVLGWYARLQRRRVSALLERVADANSEATF